MAAVGTPEDAVSRTPVNFALIRGTVDKFTGDGIISGVRRTGR
jgi:hypothetical protein